MATTVQFRIRGDTAENWERVNPTLNNRELAYDSTAKRLKVGDGLTKWNELPYVAPDVINDLVTGGIDKALSAEQGKKLKAELDTKADSSDITNIENILNDITQDITEITQITETTIKNDEITSETWRFTLDDDSVVEKKVALWTS
ncbi:MAG: hypothetical protein IJU48_06985 [Synergistaceae bacterium]|nr:hypothetical protein [Synergistaceae bacterium]